MYQPSQANGKDGAGKAGEEAGIRAFRRRPTICQGIWEIPFLGRGRWRLVEGRQEVMERKGRSARSVTFNVECLTPPAVMTGDGDGVFDTMAEVLHKRCSIQIMEVLAVSL